MSLDIDHRLLLAAEEGHLKVVERLLAANADVNVAAINHYGRTTLQAIVEEGHLKIVERLLATNVDVNVAATKHCDRTTLQAIAKQKLLKSK